MSVASSLSVHKNGSPEERLQQFISGTVPLGRTPQEVFVGVEDEDWFWLNTQGYRQSENLRSILPSLPDDGTQARIIGSAGDKALREAFTFYRLVRRLCEEHGVDLKTPKRILDFGCGWGRILRFFLKDQPPAQLVGTDSSAEMIHICRATNRWCNFELNPVEPPGAHRAESFDVIYLYSVFSHLSEESQRAWHSEFYRLLNPGGLLIATTWHREFISWCRAVREDASVPCESGWRQTLRNVFVETERHLADYDAGHFVFGPYDRALHPFAYSGNVPCYGEAVVSRKYVEAHWTDLFEIVDFIEDRTQCPQNVIVARKPAQSTKTSPTHSVTADPTISWEEAVAAVLRHADQAPVEKVAALVASLSGGMFEKPKSPSFFRACENAGVHVTPVHFYEPVPDTRSLPESLWQSPRVIPGIDWNEPMQLRLLREEFPKLKTEYDSFPHDPTDDRSQFYFNAGMFGGTDALALYCMIRHFRPNTVIEVGSGISSLVTAQAARKNGNTRLICIEPYPNDLLRSGFPGLTQLLVQPVQAVAPEQFEQLGENDILFIDSSHVVRIGSDVNYLFLEILPRLRPGVIVHVHDIFLPAEYRRDWVMDDLRFWNEQYLLQAFLIFNSGFEVLFANSYLGHYYYGEMQAAFPNSPWWGGGSFWMRRRVNR